MLSIHFAKDREFLLLFLSNITKRNKRVLNLTITYEISYDNTLFFTQTNYTNKIFNKKNKGQL